IRVFARRSPSKLVEAFARIFSAPFRNFGICTKRPAFNHAMHKRDRSTAQITLILLPIKLELKFELLHSLIPNFLATIISPSEYFVYNFEYFQDDFSDYPTVIGDYSQFQTNFKRKNLINRRAL
ncbi:MAG: hypothetical protein LBC41_01015, partial [Clostridiales bacterium]|nr:hypothetical protein [Clostridiales bacterium]